MGFTAHFSLSPFIHKMHKFANKKIKDQGLTNLKLVKKGIAYTMSFLFINHCF